MNVDITVRYSETDMMGIMHHSRYYPWFEVARTEFIKQIGISYKEMEEMGVLIPLTKSSASYYTGLKYEDKARVSCDLVKLSPARCTFSYKIVRLSDGKLTTQGMTEHGFVGKNLKAINLKKKFPSLYEKLEDLLLKQ